MQIKSRLVFHNKDLDSLRRVFTSLGVQIEEKTYDVIVNLFIDDERYPRLMDELYRMGIKPFEIRERQFTNKELDNAEFLYMGPAGYWGYPQPEARKDDWQRASYDLTTACPRCGFGAVQNRPYQVKRDPKFGRYDDIRALNWTYEFLVTERLRKLIEEAGLTGVEFWPLIRYKKNVPVEGYYQLHVTNTLPPMSPNTQFEDWPLPEAGPKRCSCGKFGRDLALDPVYRVDVAVRYERTSLLEARDFNLTSEWLGLYDARPKRIVSRRVYRLFSTRGIKRVVFEPVIVEG